MAPTFGMQLTDVGWETLELALEIIDEAERRFLAGDDGDAFAEWLAAHLYELRPEFRPLTVLRDKTAHVFGLRRRALRNASHTAHVAGEVITITVGLLVHEGLDLSRLHLLAGPGGFHARFVADVVGGRWCDGVGQSIGRGG